MANLFLVTIVNMTKKKSTANRTMEEPEVPNPSPPLSGVFVSRSPKVAPNGRVKTKAGIILPIIINEFLRVTEIGFLIISLSLL